MIRAALVCVVFMCCVLVLIVLQPSHEIRTVERATIDDTVVSRTETEFEAYEALSDNLSLLSSSVDAQLQTEPNLVSSAVTPDPKPEITAALPTPVQPEPAMVKSGDTSPPDAGNLENLIVSALTQGQSDAYIDALVNQAAARGTVTVPDSLLTEDGRVDTASLLTALTVTGIAAGIDEKYVLQPGDSLKAVSYRFFGSTAYSNDIFNANRDVLSSPTQLTAGTEIIIPAP